MSKQFRPMLAAKAEVSKIVYPVLVSPKLDGVRALIMNGKVLSRSLKPIPNRRVQLQFGKPEYEGYDGELIVGNPYSKTVYNDTIREVMTIDGPCTTDFYVFDRHDMPEESYQVRNLRLDNFSRVFVLQQSFISTQAQLLAYEQECLDIGYEGLIIRSLAGKYKYGRSTLKEGGMLKLKRFDPAEAEIIGMEELMHNANEAQISELGLTKRQTLQENQVPMGTMGALWLRDLVSGVIFKCGTGFTADDRRWFWGNLQYTGQASNGPAGEVIRCVAENDYIVKYKSFKIGEKDKPRHPVYLSLRAKWDM